MTIEQMEKYLEEARKRVYSRTPEENAASTKRVLKSIAEKTIEWNKNENDPRVIHAREYLKQQQ
jgi:predicted aspartyl protease